MPRAFNAQKAIESILYIANRIKNPGFHLISKLLYFADKTHLSKYGRLIYGDAYVAMRHGPVPTETYDLMKAIRGDGCHREAGRARESFEVVDGHNIAPLRDANMDVFSESETECFDYVIAKYGNKSFSRLTSISHDKAWKNADENDLISLEDIAATSRHSKSLIAHLRDPYPDD